MTVTNFNDDYIKFCNYISDEYGWTMDKFISKVQTGEISQEVINIHPYKDYYLKALKEFYYES